MSTIASLEFVGHRSSSKNCDWCTVLKLMTKLQVSNSNALIDNDASRLQPLLSTAFKTAAVCQRFSWFVMSCRVIFRRKCISGWSVCRPSKTCLFSGTMRRRPVSPATKHFHCYVVLSLLCQVFIHLMRWVSVLSLPVPVGMFTSSIVNNFSTRSAFSFLWYVNIVLIKWNIWARVLWSLGLYSVK